MSTEDDRCIDLVESMTAYIEGTLTDEERRRFEDHLQGCEGCQAAISQLRAVAGLAGKLSIEDVADVEPHVRDRLLNTLREVRRL